jgi:hypothetical protein
MFGRFLFLTAQLQLPFHQNDMFGSFLCYAAKLQWLALRKRMKSPFPQNDMFEPRVIQEPVSSKIGPASTYPRQVEQVFSVHFIAGRKILPVRSGAAKHRALRFLS